MDNANVFKHLFYFTSHPYCCLSPKKSALQVDSGSLHKVHLLFVDLIRVNCGFGPSRERTSSIRESASPDIWIQPWCPVFCVQSRQVMQYTFMLTSQLSTIKQYAALSSVSKSVCV